MIMLTTCNSVYFGGETVLFIFIDFAVTFDVVNV